MLTLHDCTSDYAKIHPDLSASSLPPRIVWIDILQGSADEVAYVARATGLHIPTLEELNEIENSSRLRADHGTLILSTPLVMKSQSAMAATTSVGFILTKDILITIRFAELTAFTTFTQEFGKTAGAQPNGPGAFTGLMDEIVDRLADVLENVGADLDLMSQHVFRADGNPLTKTRQKPRRPAQESADLREILRRIGRSGDLASKIRDSLLGIGRIVSYVAAMAGEWFPAELRPHLETQRHDIASLSDYDSHMANKVQLLLDATMGFISIEQNNIIKVLTVVSVVGVPPTLVASIYGMNFHHMPELDWAWGYPYGLALILFSALAPLAWFKVRGWL